MLVLLWITQWSGQSFGGQLALIACSSNGITTTSSASFIDPEYAEDLLQYPSA